MRTSQSSPHYPPYKLMHRLRSGYDIRMRSYLELEAHCPVDLLDIMRANSEPMPNRYRDMSLAFYLRDNGMEQKHLAQRSGLSRSTVSDAVRCERDPLLSTILGFSNALDWHPRDVITMLTVRPRTLSASELRLALDSTPFSKRYQAYMLKCGVRTIYGWLSEDRPVALGVCEQLVVLGWIE